MEGKKPAGNTDTNFFEHLWLRFFPYWPLFLFLVVSFFTMAFVYSRFQRPTYLASASLLINSGQGNEGNFGAQPFKTLNAYAKPETVDNEVLVLQSQGLMRKVVDSLRLYAPIMVKERFRLQPAIYSCPVQIEVQSPDSIEKAEAIPFTFDAARRQVVIDGQAYPLHSWIALPQAVIRFLPNPGGSGSNKTYFFSLYHPTTVAKDLLGLLKVFSANKLASVITRLEAAQLLGAKKGKGFVP